MSLKVNSEVTVTISQDAAAVPQEIAFSSGKRVFTDSTNYNESISLTFDVAAGDIDKQVDLGSLASVELLYFMVKATGMTVKMVPVGGNLGQTQEYEIVPNSPVVVPFKIEHLYFSNSGATAQKVVIGAAGN